jgi:imidazolonepropionase-like amidohydrolase
MTARHCSSLAPSRIACALACATVISLAAADARAQVIAVTGATVHTEPGKVIDDATVIVRDGVVRGVGKNLAIPNGARIIDGRGRVVTAGFIAASTRLGLSEVSLESGSSRGRFPSEQDGGSIHASYDVRDSYDANSVAIPVARAQGVTSAVVTPYGGLVSGTSAWFSLTPGRTSEVLVAGAIAIYAPVGAVAGGIGLLPSSTSPGWLALSRLRELFDDARAYGRQKNAFERNQLRGLAASRLDLEALLPLLAGRIPLVLRAERSSDIEAGLRLAKDYGVRLVIEGGTEAWLVADELARARAAVILDPAENLPNDFDSTNVRDDNATVLADAGVAVAIARLGSAHNVGELRQLAGIAVANGLSPERALASVTTVPAQVFGVDRGTIAVGKPADLVVWSGDPFELSTRAEHVLIAGKEQDLRTRQTLLFERYRDLAKP